MQLTVDGHQLEYRIVGHDGANAPPRTPLVLLHEGLGSVAMWKDFPDVLASSTGHPVLAYSRYGHGCSAQLTEPRSTDYMHREALTVLPQVLDELGIRQPLLVGHSDGASIAMIHAGSGHPVQGLVLMAPHVFVEDLTIDSIAAVCGSFQAGGLAARLGRYHDHPQSMFHGWSEIWLKPEFRTWNIEACVEACDAPILLIQSRDDPYGTLAQVDSIERRAIGPVEKRLFDGGGHSPHVARCDETVEAITQFVHRLDMKPSE